MGLSRQPNLPGCLLADGPHLRPWPAGAAWLLFSAGAEREYTFRTAALETGDIVAKVTATGRLGAVTVAEGGTQVSGTVKEIYADFNLSLIHI